MRGNNLKPSCVNGIKNIVSLYDVFLIDQWGVIHNGNNSYVGVLEVFKELIKEKKTIIILTNSGKTRDFNIKRLYDQFGLSPSCYTDLVSSAELLKMLLVERTSYPWSSFGNKVFIIANGLDGNLINGTAYERVSDISEADFVMLLSIAENDNGDKHQNWIAQAIEKRLFLVCPSADKLSVTPNGVFKGMASIINDYKLKGGSVINVGKPESQIYEYCTRYFPGIKLHRILAIGDHIESDIRGAKCYGIHSALVNTGATKDSFPLAKTIEDIADAIFSSDDFELISPNWILPSLKW